MSKTPRPGPLLVDVAGLDLTAEDRALMAHPAVGGVILFTRNYAAPGQLAALTAAMRAARPNLLILADTEGGRVQRFRDGFTRIPAMARLGALARQDPALAASTAREIGWLMASELACAGVDMPLAPVLDIDQGVSTVIGDRAFAGDGAIVAALAGALAEGLVEAGSAATAKHFPGHGHVAADSHAELPVDNREYPAIESDMAPYRALMAAGLDSVMMAHVRYPAVDPLPASFSARWIDGILRGGLGFAGCVFCDDLSMGGAAAAVGDYLERAALALHAGCDYLPVCNDRAAAARLVDHMIPVAADDAVTARRQRLRDTCQRRPSAGSAAALHANPRWQAARAIIAQLGEDD